MKSTDAPPGSGSATTAAGEPVDEEPTTTMDIAQVSHLYRPAIGGIENYVYRLNGAARAAGHSATTYTTDLSLSNDDSPLSGEESVEYCATDLAPYRNPISRELYRRIAASDHDVYHLHNPWFLAAFEGAVAAPDDSAVVMTVHSAEIKSHSPLIKLLNVAYRPFATSIFKRVDHCFVQGASEKRRLLDRFDVGPETVSVVPNGIYPDEYDVPAERVEQFRETHDLDPAVPTVLYVSRLIEEKNPDVFVEAVTEHLGERDLQALVVDDVVGVAVADDRIQFCANLEFEALKAAYHAGDCFAFLGTWEGLPTVILEAMNARLPVVTTPVGAIGDVVHEPDNGTMVDSPPDAGAVAQAIDRYLADPEHARSVGEHNREDVLANYHWDDVAEAIMDTYTEVTR